MLTRSYSLTASERCLIPIDVKETLPYLHNTDLKPNFYNQCKNLQVTLQNKELMFLTPQK